MNVQIGSTNVAGGDEEVAVQVGRIGGPAPDEAGVDLWPAGTTVNERYGDATVGKQADAIVGGADGPPLDPATDVKMRPPARDGLGAGSKWGVRQ